MLDDITTAAGVNADHTIAIGFGSGNLGFVKQQPVTWKELVEILSSPAAAEIDHAVYMGLSKEQRNELKKRDRFMLPGVCRAGRRDDAHLESRSAATLDVDENAGMLYGQLLFSEPPDVTFAYAWHTTRSHTEDRPRLRIVVPFSRPVSPAEYRRIVPALGAAFGVAYDPASVKPAQMMFLPVRNAGAPFECGSAFGSGFVDPNALLGSLEVVERAQSTAVELDDMDPEWVEPRPEKIAELESALLHLAARETGYNCYMTRAQNLKSLGEIGYASWIKYVRAQSDYDGGADHRAKWEQCPGDRSDYRAIFKAAGEAGWRKPIEAYIEPIEADADGNRINSFELALTRAEAPIRSDLIKGVIPDAEFGIIFGASGAGKSFAAIDLGYHLAQGVAWRGRKVKQRGVFYIAAEGAHGVRRRAKAYALHHGVDALTPFYTRERPVNMHAKNGWVHVAEDINTLRGERPGVIFIDTLSRSIPGVEENSARDMSQVIENCQMLARATQCMVIAVAHAGKDSEKGVRGSSALRAAADFEISVTRHLETQWRCLKLTKSKDDIDGIEFGFTLAQVDVGVDEEGDVVLSAVAVPSDERPTVVNTPQGRAQRQVFDVVVELSDFSDDVTVAVEQVIDRVLELNPSAGGGRRTNIRRTLLDMCEGENAFLRAFDNNRSCSIAQNCSDRL
jgi:hypothetical protein